MNKSSLLNVLLAVALVIMSVKTLSLAGHTEVTQETKTTDTIMENIMTRTSIRAYQDREVEDAKIDTLLRAAMAAPTACNKQPWEFVVIKNKETLKTMAEQFGSMGMAAKAPLAIVICGNLDNALPDEGQAYWIQDTSAATENLLLAAHGMGLGAVWCGVYPVQERVKYIKELLGLPENVVPLNVIPVGYPAEDPQPKDKWEEARVHYESWNGKK